MKAMDFLMGMDALGVSFYTGVPDSLLKPLNDTLFAKYGASNHHIVAANEGGAVGLAAGHFIATGKPALCYLQNSGIGNIVNPVASLLNERVYGIPCVFVVGWRGEPGVKDEPQHAFQGVITKALLEVLELTVFELDKQTSSQSFQAMLASCQALLNTGKSVSFLVHKNGLTDAPEVSYPDAGTLSREDALREILMVSDDRDIFVSTTGKTSREVFELREQLSQDHAHDFLTVGSMGHASMIALGIAMEKPNNTVWCLDGDGAALMHMGSLAVESRQAAPNMIHVLLNNGAHESVGGMPVVCGDLRFTPIAQALGFECVTAQSAAELCAALLVLRNSPASKPRFVEVLLKQGSRDDLGRPTQTPNQNLQGLMQNLNGGKEATKQ